MCRFAGGTVLGATVAAVLLAAAPAGAAPARASQERLTVSGARSVELLAASPVRALVVREARARRCGRRGARLTVRVATRAPRVFRVRGARSLRVGARLAAGTHRVTLRARPRGRCAVHLRDVRFEQAAAGTFDPATAPPRPVPLAAAVDKRTNNHWFDSRYAPSFVQRFDGLTPENVLKMETVWTDIDRYDFTRTDQVLGLAATNGKSIHGHVLFWDRQLPRWMVERSWNPTDLQARVRAYFGLVMGRYRDTVREWDVVNEPLNDDGNGLRRSFWMDNFGPSYVEQAFRWAHEANPAARLFLNDFDTEDPGPKADALERLLRDLLSRGVPIHGVGFQFHSNLLPVRDVRAVYQHLKRFADLGLEVQVTEMDVAIPPNRQADPASRRHQAQHFVNVAKACNALPACTRFTVWGVTDRYSFRGAGTTPLLIDTDYRPKPVYDELRKVFAPVR
ncbi:MAG TPA: endo-1,4-beta-xylanase [Baekduia sp.]|nr:endo-1,4-beta-xylanase [Baekduia sp.]